MENTQCQFSKISAFVRKQDVGSIRPVFEQFQTNRDTVPGPNDKRHVIAVTPIRDGTPVATIGETRASQTWSITPLLGFRARSKLIASFSQDANTWGVLGRYPHFKPLIRTNEGEVDGQVLGKDIVQYNRGMRPSRVLSAQYSLNEIQTKMDRQVEIFKSNKAEYKTRKTGRVKQNPYYNNDRGSIMHHESLIMAEPEDIEFVGVTGGIKDLGIDKQLSHYKGTLELYQELTQLLEADRRTGIPSLQIRRYDRKRGTQELVSVAYLTQLVKLTQTEKDHPKDRAQIMEEDHKLSQIKESDDKRYQEEINQTSATREEESQRIRDSLEKAEEGQEKYKEQTKKLIKHIKTSGMSETEKQRKAKEKRIK